MSIQLNKTKVLISSETRIDANMAMPASDVVVEEYRKHCVNMFGNDNMPSVVYKGKLIRAGKLGAREIEK